MLKTLPATAYHDPKYFEAERKSVFATQWLYVADLQQLKNPGDYLSFELAGYPLILLRGVGKDAEKIRGFHNVCRHRAGPLVTQPQGNLKHGSMTCIYHGWTYNLSGSLIQAPHCDTEKLRRDCDVSLMEVQVGYLNDLIFINLDPTAKPFSEAMQPMLQEVLDSGYPMQEYTESGSMVQEGEFNWKVWVDGYQECYHCATIHPILNKDFHLKKYQINNKDGYSVHSCERRSASSMGGFSGLWLWAYPNLGMPCYEPCYYTLQVNPLSATRTQLNYRFHFKSGVSAEVRKEFEEMVRRITAEDMLICEKVQKNLNAGVFKDGILTPERENGVMYFHSLVRRAVETQGIAPQGSLELGLVTALVADERAESAHA